MKKLILPLALAAGVLMSATMKSNGEADERSSASGKSIFVDNKCTKCHSIESQGLQRAGDPPPGGKLPPDLSGVGLKHDTEWMTKWLHKEVEQNGKKHMKKFSGSDDELKTLTTWLATLKKK
jgi:cbb3-type cytochrome oxidase cytochrome c subunit